MLFPWLIERPDVAPDPLWICSVGTNTNQPNSAGGGGTDGGDAGGGGGGDGGEDAPVTMAALRGLMKEHSDSLDKSWKDRFAKVNRELQGRRHKARGDAASNTDTEGEDTEPSSSTPAIDPRADARAWRSFDREIEKLREASVDPEVLEELELNAEELAPEQRAKFASAIARVFELGRNSGASSKNDEALESGEVKDGERRRGRRQETENRTKTRGGEPPPRTKTVALPTTWDDFLREAKDPKRKAELDKEIEAGKLDLQELRQKSRRR